MTQVVGEPMMAIVSWKAREEGHCKDMGTLSVVLFFDKKGLMNDGSPVALCIKEGDVWSWRMSDYREEVTWMNLLWFIHEVLQVPS